MAPLQSGRLARVVIGTPIDMPAPFPGMSAWARDDGTGADRAANRSTADPRPKCALFDPSSRVPSGGSNEAMPGAEAIASWLGNGEPVRALLRVLALQSLKKAS